MWKTTPNFGGLKKEKGKAVIKGKQLEGFATRTNFRNRDGMERLRNILHRKGVFKELEREGFSVGDTIQIAGKEFKW